jgi:YidC/Oxa1 family membrane protein insertase
VDNRRLMLAILLSWAAVMVWSLTFGPKPETDPQEPAPQVEPANPEHASRPGTVGTSDDSDRSVAPSAAAPPPGQSGEEGSPTGSVPEGESRPEPIAASYEEVVEVDTSRYLARFSNRGAQLVSFDLKGYEGTEGGDLDLVRQRRGDRYPFSLVVDGLEEAALNDALFQVAKEESVGGETVLTFTYRGAEGAATKRFTLAPEGLFEVDIQVTGAPGWGVFLGPGVENPTEEVLRRPQFPRRVVYDAGDGREIIDAQGLKEAKFLPGGSLQWVALTDSYFLAALLPAEGIGAVEVYPFMIEPGLGEEAIGTLVPLPPKEQRTKEEDKNIREAALILRATGDQMVLGSYWGAKVYEDLKALRYGLEKTVNFGWFTFLARPLHLGLQWIHGNLVSNYGWAIVLMTILIRLIMLPLTHTSMKSMQKMQELNPKMQAIRAKFRPKLKDKQGRPNLEAQKAMNDEIMGLYKSEGVNPAGGCLPMLLQFPVFLAFYGLLGGAIELRHAPWLLWVQDLSLADPYFVLPTVMGISQLVQQLRMPMGGDPLQRKLFLLMPVIFWFVFLKFPAGLVLYWLTNNIFGILQQEVYKVIRGDSGAIIGGKKSVGSTKGSKNKKG